MSNFGGGRGCDRGDQSGHEREPNRPIFLPVETVASYVKKMIRLLV